MLLDYFGIAAASNKPPQRTFYTTGSTKMFDEIANDWLEINVEAQHIELGGAH